MITDNLTNTVYFSSLLPKKCPVLNAHIVDALQKRGVPYFYLSGAKDIWCRDYMPIQIKPSRFVFYKYNPDYLQTPYYRRTITDINHIDHAECLTDVDATHLDLVIDGGNIVKCGESIVMTEKVFAENGDKPRKEVERMLEDAFLCNFIFLPWDRNEVFGHSDGIIHYIGNNQILLTNYADIDLKMASEFRKILEQHFDITTLVYNVRRKHQHSWAYINFLQIGSLVLVPQLDIDEDVMALQQIAEVMPECEVVGIPALEAVRKGGALNCVSWNVQS